MANIPNDQLSADQLGAIEEIKKTIDGLDKLEARWRAVEGKLDSNNPDVQQLAAFFNCEKK